MVMPLPDTGPTNGFYDSWSNYLHPYPRLFLSMMQQGGQMCMSAIYNISNGAYTAWQKAWDLIDFSTIFTSANGSGADATGFHLVKLIPIFLVLGLILWGIVMAVQVFEFTATSGKKGREWPMGFVTIIICLGFAPILMTGATQIAKAMNSEIMERGTDKNPMLNILQNNSVDLKKVGQQNFNVPEKDFQKYSPVGKDANDGTVNDPVFTAVMSDDSAKKNITSKSVKSVFEKKKGDEGNPVALDKGAWVTGGQMAEEYPRVKVNWLGVIVGFAAFGFAVFLAIIELLLRFYRLAAYSIMMLYFAFRDAGGKRAIQIMQLLEGSLTGLALMPLSVMLFFGFMQFGMNKISAMGLSWWPFTLLSIGLILAGTKGLLSGFSLIDQWTGVPSGQGSALQTAGAGAVAAVGSAKLGASAAKTAGSIASAGTDLIDKAHASGQEQSKKLAAWMDQNGDDDDYSYKDASESLSKKMADNKQDGQSSDDNSTETDDTSNEDSSNSKESGENENTSNNQNGEADNPYEADGYNKSDQPDQDSGDDDASVPENDTDMPDGDFENPSGFDGDTDVSENDMDIPDLSDSAQAVEDDTYGNAVEPDIPENDIGEPETGATNSADGLSDNNSGQPDIPDNMSDDFKSLETQVPDTGNDDQRDIPGEMPVNNPEQPGNNNVSSGGAGSTGASSFDAGSGAPAVNGNRSGNTSRVGDAKSTSNKTPGGTSSSGHTSSDQSNSSSHTISSDAASEMFPVPDVAALFGKDSSTD